MTPAELRALDAAATQSKWKLPTCSDVRCGNAKHPDGAWHPATGLQMLVVWRPSSWVRCWLYRRNEKHWGCGCPRRRQ